jgi:hypothetical protein
MTVWLLVLVLVTVGAGLVAYLAARVSGALDGTFTTFDDARRDLRLAVVEVRVERDRIVRRVDDVAHRA